MTFFVRATSILALALVACAVTAPLVVSAATPVLTGKAAAEGLGSPLPAGLAAPAVIALIAPGQDEGRATLIGARPWPHRPNTLIAIACFHQRPAGRNTGVVGPGQPSCATAAGDGTPKQVHLGLIEWRAGTTPRLLARTEGAIDAHVSWQNSELASPGDTAPNEALWPADFVRFDFAPYQLSPTDTAFGLRTQWTESYAGGGDTYEALLLFAVKGDRIVRILAEPVYQASNLAGDWNGNGTREHEKSETRNVVRMLDSTSNGYRDLQIRTQGHQWTMVFVWDDKLARYAPRKH